MSDLHKVALEEFLQLPLSCRVREVANVEAAALSGAGSVGLGLGGLVIVLASKRGVGQSVSDVVDGLGSFLHDSRHGD